MSDSKYNKTQHDFYRYGIMEMIHELGNIVQKMICLAYEMESNNIVNTKLNHKINLMTQMVKVYTGLYTNSTYSFQEMIEMIQLFHNCPIHLVGNYSDLHENDQEFVNLKRVLLIYSMWLSKRHEFQIEIFDNYNAKLSVLNDDSIKTELVYTLDNDSIYSQILRSFEGDGFDCRMSGTVIELSTSNFQRQSTNNIGDAKVG